MRLFLADGTPGSLPTAEIMSWTGHTTAAPRSEPAALLQREEATRTGGVVVRGSCPQRLVASATNPAIASVRARRPLSHR